MNDNPWVIAILLIVAGAFIAFYGRKFFKWTISIVSGGMTFFILMLLFSAFGMLKRLEGNKEGSVFLVVLAFFLAIGLGVLVGFIILKLQRYGAAILIATVGFFAGVNIYNILLAWTENLYIYLALAFGCAIAAFYLSFKYYHKILITTTSVLGSYAFFRGISMFAGGFPNEIQLMQDLANGDAEKPGWPFYLYIVGIALMAVGAYIF